MMVNQNRDPGCRRPRAINTGGFLARSTVNGPGIRAVIWVQGCPIHCAGCFNPQFWSFRRAERIPVPALADRIFAIEGIDGVTFSGGEPFAQAGALAQLGTLIRDAGLSVVTFTGYSADEVLTTTRDSWRRLMDVTDLLVAGPYARELSCVDPLIASSNQRVIPVSGRIPAHGEPDNLTAPVEFSISPDGTLTTTGFPDPGLAGVIASIGQEE